MIAMIDNYDSFTYNLVQYFQMLNQSVQVFRNDQISIEELEMLQPNHIVISPGPGSPKDAGISLEIIHHFQKICPILGICLGHQCIAQYFGAKIIKAQRIMHGKTSLVHHNNQTLFTKIPTPFKATRYHSLAIDPKTLPDTPLTINAWTEEPSKINEIMAIDHQSLPIHGIQFHPESILTEHGLDILSAFLSLYPNK